MTGLNLPYTRASAGQADQRPGRPRSSNCSSPRSVNMARLYVEGTNGRVEVQVDLSSDTVRTLKRMIEELEGTPSSRQLLTCSNGVTLSNNDALLSSFEFEGTSLRLGVIPNDHLVVVVEQGQEATMHFTVGPGTTGLALKGMIEQDKGHPIAKQVIKYRGGQLADGTILHSLLSEAVDNLVVTMQLELLYQVTLHLHTGDTVNLIVDWNEPVETLETIVIRRGRVAYHHQDLMYDGQMLEMGHTINEYGVTDGAHITVNLREYETMVFIKTLTGRTIMVMVGPRDTVAQVKRKIERQEGIPAGHQRLVFVGEQLRDHHRLLDYRIEHESTVHLVLRSGDSYEVFVDTPGGRSHTFEVLPTDNLAYIKNRLRERDGIPLDIMELYLGEQKLVDDSATLREIGVTAGSLLRLTIDQGRDTQIFVGLPNRDSLSLWVSGDMTVAQLKEVVAQRSEIPADLQQLYFARQQLENERTLNSYTIENNHMLHVEIAQPPMLKLTVRFPDSSELELEVADNFTVAALKREIEAKKFIPLNQQQLFFQGIELDSSSQLRQCGVNDRSVLDLSSSRPVASAAQGSGQDMHLFVKTLTGKTVTVVVNPTDTILDVKRRIMDKEGVALSHQCLICGGKQLDNSASIQDCGIQHQSVLHLVLRVPSQGPVSLTVQRGDLHYTVDGVSMSETVAQLKVS